MIDLWDDVLDWTMGWFFRILTTVALLGLVILIGWAVYEIAMH